MRTLAILTALLVGCAGGGELQQPNPPPEWPLGGADVEALPTGEDAVPPTAPPAGLEVLDDIDADADADTDAPPPDDGPPEPASADPAAPAAPAPEGAPEPEASAEGSDAN